MRSLLGFLLAIATLVVVLAVVQWETTELASPGPLHGAHRDIVELQGATGCVQCHSGEGRDLADSCAACHEEIGAQLESGEGLHGALESRLGRTCGQCHIEHVGDELPLVGAHAFGLAGVRDRDAYDHHHVAGFDLTGRHDELACRECHRHADDVTLAPGSRRFLGLTTECTSCHEDPHVREFGGDCASCHGQEHRFDVVAEFDHDARFPLTGAHAGVGCTQCHEGASIRDGVDESIEVRACATCHENPHDASAPRAVRLTNVDDCARCHETTTFAETRFGVDDHATVSFALLGPHRDVGCATCHGDARKPASFGDARSVEPDACATCHESPHREDFVAELGAMWGVEVGATCSKCHDFDHATFRAPNARLEADAHAASGFRLEIPHDEVACTSCHKVADESPFAERFPGRDATACATCHGDPHDGQFQGSTCTDCHASTHFAPSLFDLDAHARTSFTLDGAHAAMPCSACHEQIGEGARRFRGVSTACETCHADPHAGRFDGDGVPAAIDGRVGCARCHNTTVFDSVEWDAAAHAMWTGYELEGAHAQARCVDCHGQPFRDAPQSCADCHEDVHHGQFQVAGQTDCRRCHQVAGSFRDLVFDHGRDTRFRLDENHARLECADCHVARPTRSGELVVRYRPLGRECRDCHVTERDR